MVSDYCLLPGWAAGTMVFAEGGRVERPLCCRERRGKGRGRGRRLGLVRAIVFLGLVVCMLLGSAHGCYENKGDKIKIGSDTYVCLVLSNAHWFNTTGSAIPGQTYRKSVFKLKADQFSRLEIVDSWVDPEYAKDPLVREFGPTVAVSVESGAEISYQKVYRRHNVTFPIYTAIIVVEHGDVKGIVWDEGCWACDKSECEKNTLDYDAVQYKAAGRSCYMKDTECRHEAGDRYNQIKDFCELNVFVVWSGTDEKGTRFDSMNKRFSRFSQYSVESYADRLKDDIKNVSTSWG